MLDVWCQRRTTLVAKREKLRRHLMAAKTNDQVLLDAVLKDYKKAAPSQLSESELFEFFCCEQVLKDYDLSPDEILAGMTGGGQEGGVDALFVFENGRLVEDDYDHGPAGKGVVLEIYAFESKRTASFKEDAIQKADDTLTDLLALSKSRGDLEAEGLYSEALIERSEIARNALTKLAPRAPDVRITFVYATKGAIGKIASGVKSRAERLEAHVTEQLSQATATVEFVGARELYQLSQRSRVETLPLEYQGGAISDGESGYVALVKLGDYFSFVTDHGALRRHILEGNVRDHEGDVEVNRGIRKTLEQRGGPEFWWLNNGITIIGTKVWAQGRIIYIENPEVVNGLQTTMELFSYFSRNGARKGDERQVLVRVIGTRDEEVRNRIIRSTNSQTSVPVASLYATDQLQRDIETFFRHRGWFYERRKNYYRNLEKPADRIISIPYLAQAVMSIGLGQASTARARPSSLLKKREDYELVFDPSLPVEVYLWAAKTQRQVDEFLRSDKAKATNEERSNLRFHMAMLLACKALGQRVFSANQLAAATSTTFSDDELAEILKTVRSEFKREQKRTDMSMDRVAKNGEFSTKLLNKFYPVKKKTAVA